MNELAQKLEITLVLIKPDGVRRGLVGEILHRIEQTGLKITGMKMLTPSQEQAGKHYTYEDIAVRHGEHVRNALINFITSGPIIALAVEGVAAVENLRRLCGSTDPSKSPPGTIRGDFSHHNFAYVIPSGQSVRNLIHASATVAEAASELAVWFEESELLTYRRSDQEEHFLF